MNTIDEALGGVQVYTNEGAGSVKAAIGFCPFPDRTVYASVITLAANQMARVTCGSVTVEVISGPIEAVFHSGESRNAAR